MSRIFLAITLCLALLAISVDAQDRIKENKRLNSKRSNKSNVRRRSRLPAGGQPLCDPTPYPAIPQNELPSGMVRVQVLIDEGGKVISARALSGDPRFQKAAVDAAMKEIF